MKWTTEQIEQMRLGRPVYGDSQKAASMTWLRTAKETGGEYSLAYAEGKPNYTVFPHTHTQYTESSQVIEGSLAVRVGDTTFQLGPGDDASVPPRVEHTWTSGPDGISSALVELRPAHEGFEKWIVMLENMHAAGLTKPDQQPKSFVHTALLLVESDTHLVGKARMLDPVFKAVAWVAHRAGVARRLEEKYYKPGLLTQ